jgi:diguanylate cyclase (GGDEF)-like protein
MNLAIPTPAGTSSALGALDLALAQSHEVRDKVEQAADDLALKNEVIKQQISQGQTTLPANESLEAGEGIEATFKEAADDLSQVTESLAAGVGDLKKVEAALADSKRALERTEETLADAQEAERLSSLRALHDAATGLPNRTLFDDRLGQAISLAERNGWTLAVMFLDLDRFKLINDEHGHAAGDFVLKEVASRLIRHARDEDTVCRNGGDEFLYLLVNPQGQDNVVRIAADILSNVARPIAFDGLELSVGLSIGIALFPACGTTGAELIGNADAAMYIAKRHATRCAVWVKPG